MKSRWWTGLFSADQIWPPSVQQPAESYRSDFGLFGRRRRQEILEKLPNLFDPLLFFPVGALWVFFCVSPSFFYNSECAAACVHVVHVSAKLSENMSIKMCVYRDANPTSSSLAAWRRAHSNVFRVSVCIINDDVSAKLSTTDLAQVVQICASLHVFTCSCRLPRPVCVYKVAAGLWVARATPLERSPFGPN